MYLYAFCQWVDVLISIITFFSLEINILVFKNLKYDHISHFFFCSSLFEESTQTVQALQYSTADGPLTASKDLEIKTLKEEIENLRKQIRGKFL